MEYTVLQERKKGQQKLQGESKSSKDSHGPNRKQLMRKKKMHLISDQEYFSSSSTVNSVEEKKCDLDNTTCPKQ